MMADSNRFKNIRRYKEDPPQKTPPENCNNIYINSIIKII